VNEPEPASAPPPRVPLFDRRFAFAGALVVVGIAAALLASRGSPAATAQPCAHYFYVSEIEVAPRPPAGGAWDAVDPAPDPVVEVHAEGLRIHRSAAKQDTFVARWSAVSLRLDNLRDGSPDGIVRAARLTYPARAGAEVEVRVFDADLAFDDLIASWRVRLADLAPGTTRVLAPAPGVVRVVYELIPCDQGGVALIPK
jgi:hypothetical protein